MGDRLVVVGIGNPGPAYARTRHNVGVTAVERLAGQLRVELKRRRGRFRSGEGSLEGRPVTLAVPTTFMNESGRPVAGVVRKAGVKPRDLVVVHDELDIPLGTVRLKDGGGTAGHNGLRSIEASLRSRDFLRVRIGIGRPEVGSDATDKVLSAFAPGERPTADKSIDLAIEGLRVLAREGLDAAQNVVHSTPPIRGADDR